MMCGHVSNTPARTRFLFILYQPIEIKTDGDIYKQIYKSPLLERDTLNGNW
jgi:hypothetical protein